eukprot:GAHX01010344.1.p1 GENE.GAHX01010344.1~~GAHX01010344.1.p1  ORF type:complete len:59 (-),score=2.20 GAHX01010344.1:25-201(-)
MCILGYPETKRLTQLIIHGDLKTYTALKGLINEIKRTIGNYNERLSHVFSNLGNITKY